MGMFDYVTCEYPLPHDGANTYKYQTKSFQYPSLVTYIIRVDGTLWRQSTGDDDPSQPYPFHGDVFFYDFLESNPDKGWIEWKATFDQGKLTHIELFELREPNQEKP